LPWLRRADWARRRIVYTNRPMERFLWAMTGTWGLVALPVLLVLGPAAIEPGRQLLPIGLIVPASEVLMLALAVRATQRRRFFGDSVFELLTVPGEIGGTLEGVLHLSRPLHASKPMTLTLLCLDRTTRQTTNGSATSQRTLWQSQKKVAPPIGEAVSVAFAIPDDNPPTCFDGREVISWNLQVIGDDNGRRYKSNFDVPVFPAVLTPPQASEAAAVRARSQPTVASQEPGSRIRVRDTLAGGKEFYFPPCRNLGATWFVTLFLTFWSGGIIVMIVLKAPLFFPIGFGVFALLMTWFLIYLLLWRTRVLANPGMLTISSGFLSESRVHRIPASQILRISFKTSMTFNDREFLNIVVILNDGKRFTAGTDVESHIEARWLAAEMAKSAGVTAAVELPGIMSLTT
jgi:hypothetical protein